MQCLSIFLSQWFNINNNCASCTCRHAEGRARVKKKLFSSTIDHNRFFYESYTIRTRMYNIIHINIIYDMVTAGSKGFKHALDHSRDESRKKMWHAKTMSVLYRYSYIYGKQKNNVKRHEFSSRGLLALEEKERIVQNEMSSSLHIYIYILNIGRL